jgi:hypothetical protein
MMSNVGRIYPALSSLATLIANSPAAGLAPGERGTGGLVQALGIG